MEGTVKLYHIKTDCFVDSALTIYLGDLVYGGGPGAGIIEGPNGVG